MVAIAIVSIQFGASFAKRLFPVVGATGTTALRLAMAATILVVVLRPWRVRPSAGAWRALLGYGAALGCMNLLFYLALRTVPLGIAVALEFTGPLAVALRGARGWRDYLWIGLAVAGMALLLPVGGQINAVDPAGGALALAAGVCWALYIVSGKVAGTEIGTASAAIGAVIAAMIALPIGIATAGFALLAPNVLFGGLVVAVFSSALPYTFEMMALTRMPARSFGMLMSGEPAVAAVMGAVILGESLTVGQGLAIGAIVAASVGTTMTVSPAADLHD